MPRLPRVLAAGLLLFGAAEALGALLLPGPVAAAVFVPLWYFIAVVNAGMGVVSAGYALRSEIMMCWLVFGAPAMVAIGVAAVWAPVVTGGRIWFVWVAGAALWGAVWLLIGLLTPASASGPVSASVAGPASASGPVSAPAAGPGSASARAVAGLAVLVFGPLWLIICGVNLVVGVRSAGYSVAEEVPVLLANAALPLAVAVAAWRLTRGRRAGT
jgi:hypothetical protein